MTSECETQGYFLKTVHIFLGRFHLPDMSSL